MTLISSATVRWCYDFYFRLYLRRLVVDLRRLKLLLTNIYGNVENFFFFFFGKSSWRFLLLKRASRLHEFFFILISCKKKKKFLELRVNDGSGKKIFFAWFGPTINKQAEEKKREREKKNQIPRYKVNILILIVVSFKRCIRVLIRNFSVASFGSQVSWALFKNHYQTGRRPS